ncbi:DUF6292 family protein [Amycolatopsis sp. H20-H5]|uniref:DUF6292 family protein n=1 Tax=Amycolatopsis sp. H20-H5 TaxID=3046309 RepID=UPI002DB6CE86|nr:DUF6292 family protein [Amycolatopsis sp. H20-H5]MEC3976456.1 DUF6292 family protein [Amycolatopsis sp. H20-H5]
MDTQAGGMSAMTRGLAGYIRRVADAVGVTADGVTHEVSDTATAYLALARRSPRHPERDLMLFWSERHGWAVAVEEEHGDHPKLVAYFGEELVPSPAQVAEFVAAVTTGRSPAHPRPRFAEGDDRRDLTVKLAPYVEHFA